MGFANLLQQEGNALQRKKDMKVAAEMAGQWRLLGFSQTEGLRAATGIHVQLGDIVSQHLDALYSYALVISRNPTVAEDLVQETCARAIRAMGSLREDSNVKSWLFTILRNIWLNQLREQRVAPKLVELDVDESIADVAVATTEDPLTSYINKVEQQRVRQAIQQLPVHFREIIVLREFEELSYEEIATLLNCPAGTVMSRLARARAKLRDLLLEHGPSAGQRGATER